MSGKVGEDFKGKDPAMTTATGTKRQNVLSRFARDFDILVHFLPIPGKLTRSR